MNRRGNKLTRILKEKGMTLKEYQEHAKEEQAKEKFKQQIKQNDTERTLDE